MPLQRYSRYSRQQVNEELEPSLPFTRGSGKWGMWGIVKVGGSEDVVLFVTFGAAASGVVFDDESIDIDGVFAWKSQPSQTLRDEQIQNFLNHDDSEEGKILLFLRTNKKSDYVFMGELTYVSHDPVAERPVRIKWQIIDFDSEKARQALPDLQLCEPMPGSWEQDRSGLVETHSTGRTMKSGRRVVDAVIGRQIDFESIGKNNTRAGALGEQMAFEFEKARLRSLCREDLAEKVALMSDVDNAAPYDMQSFDEHGMPLFIEVKSTTGPLKTPIFISSGELAFAETHSDAYVLYRVYRLDCDAKRGKIESFPFRRIQEAAPVPVTYTFSI